MDCLSPLVLQTPQPFVTGISEAFRSHMQHLPPSIFKTQAMAREETVLATGDDVKRCFKMNVARTPSHHPAILLVTTGPDKEQLLWLWFCLEPALSSV